MATQNVVPDLELLSDWPVRPIQPVIPVPVPHSASPPGIYGTFRHYAGIFSTLWAWKYGMEFPDIRKAEVKSC